MKLSSAAGLKSAVAKLQAERLTHQKSIAEIDSVFADLGIKLSVPMKRGPKPGKRKVGRPKGSKTAKAAVAKKKSAAAKKPVARKRFSVPGHQMVLNLVKTAGKSGAKTSMIVKAWEKQGRGGAAYNVIGDLVDSKKIKREKLKGREGSLYRLA